MKSIFPSPYNSDKKAMDSDINSCTNMEVKAGSGTSNVHIFNMSMLN